MEDCAFCGQSSAGIENRRKMVVWPNNRKHTIFPAIGFHVRAVILDNHPRNMSAFNMIKHKIVLTENNPTGLGLILCRTP